MKRRWRDADVYLFFNESAQRIGGPVTLTSLPGAAELWDPQTGTKGPPPVQIFKGTFAVALNLGPYETRVVVVRQTPADDSMRR
jgi:hypothetical protein